MMCISAGYFLWDVTFCLLQFKIEHPFFLIHAMVCCITYGYGFIFGFVHYYGAVFLLWECSTPFYHVEWLMAKLKVKDNPLYLLNSYAMVFVFFIARIAWGWYLTQQFLVDVWTVKNSPPGAKSLFALSLMTLNMINLYWFKKLLFRILYKTVEAEEDGRKRK